MKTATDLLKKFLLSSVFVLLLTLYPNECFANQCNTLEECTLLYHQAIVDAGTYEPSESEELMPIVEEQVSVATWTSSTRYRLGSNTLGADIWVTLVPQLQEKCQTFIRDMEALDLRLEQLLGLPPKSGKTQVVEMVIRSSDLFRPCPDSDISKTECSQYFPENVTRSYVNWLAKNLLDSYQIPGGYPWTRLGYTYDWNPDSPEFGLSEYVVRKGSSIEVTSISPTFNYCSP
jgi:hypothetical protein